MRAAVDIPPKPRRIIIDRSVIIARAEEELSKAFFVSVVGHPAAVSVDILADELALRYELLMQSLEFHYLGPNEYMLVLPDEAMVGHVYNEGCPLQVSPFTLCFRRWSRLKKAANFVLPSFINVELPLPETVKLSSA